MMADDVRAWRDKITLPTYSPPAPDLNPMFLEKRVNQGTSGRVYPNPFLDQLSSKSEPQEYEAVFLENEYLRLTMLPKIGGRLHEAVDKTNGYHIIYRQSVVKPALIGLFGSWMSGGIEYNWPQHHRPSTFMPVQHLIEEHPDGSKTVWLSENDPMQRMKGMVGICLYPGKAFFEMKVQLYNRTPEVQTFLWWINVGVHVHEGYQVVFPPDVTVVTDHSKRSMSHYPISHETYYGIDYNNEGKGTDLSWFGAIPVPTSYFVWGTEYDFFGGYDHRADAGIIHVANRHIAPGKKMFTWGAGEFAKGWEANLTDEDGPYIELMAGVYTDNQPDFSWLQPYETKTFSQFWYPVQRIGPAKNANRRAALNLELREGTIRIGVAVTERMPRASLALEARDPSRAGTSGGFRTLLGRTVVLVPGSPFIAQVACPEGVAETDLVLRLSDAEGREIIRYAPQAIEIPELPEAKTPPPPPETFDTIEELYLTGLHLEQYRHPTIEPEPYWEEALTRDPTDTRCNNAMGLSDMRRGLFADAIEHFTSAIDKLTHRNPNPRNGEVSYNLGRALKYQAAETAAVVDDAALDLDAAYAAFYKAVWSYAWQAPGYYAIAEIDCLRGNFEQALEHLTRSLRTNTLNVKARNLKTAVLRRLGRMDEAAAMACETVGMDPLDIASRNEAILISRAQEKPLAAESQLAELTDLMDVPDALSKVQAYLDVALDYANAGLWSEAVDLLGRLVGDDEAYVSTDAVVAPTVFYTLGYLAHMSGEGATAPAVLARAAEMPTDYCFPARLEEMIALEYAQTVRPDDAKIAYYLGNLYYDKQRYNDAIAKWELATELMPEFSIPWRNLGLAAFNVRHRPDEAVRLYMKAFSLAPGDGRILSELDQLLARTGVSPEERLSLLESHLDLVRARDDLSGELAALYNLTDQPQKALDYVLSRRFHPWEGGTGRVSRQYVRALLALGRAALADGDAGQALLYFERADATYPENLGERKHLLWPDAHVAYHIGLAKQALGDATGAEAAFQRVLDAAGGDVSETAYWQGLALRALGRGEEAEAIFTSMLEEAGNRLSEQAEGGFATSVPEFVFAEADRETRRRTYLTYLTGLAYVGIRRVDDARKAFEDVLALSPGNADATRQLRALS